MPMRSCWPWSRDRHRRKCKTDAGLKKSARRIRGLVGLALLVAAVLFMLWPVDEGLESIPVHIEPASHPLVAEKKLIVLKVVAPPYSRVKRGQALLQVFTDQRVLDEAIAASAIEAALPRILQASGGVETSTVKQLRTKLKYLRELLTKSKNTTFIYSPRDGYVVYSQDVTGFVHSAGASIGEILEPDHAMAYLDLDPRRAETIEAKGEVMVSGLERVGPAGTKLYLDGLEAGGLDLPQGLKEAKGKAGIGGFNSVEYWAETSARNNPPTKGTLPVVPNGEYQFVGEIQRISWENRIRLGRASEPIRKEAERELKGIRVRGDERDDAINAVPSLDLSVTVWQQERGEEPTRARIWVNLPSPWLADAAVSCRVQGQRLQGEAFIKRGSRPRWQRLFAP